MRTTLIAMLIGGALVVACDDRASSTTTTAASGNTATEDLKQAGRDLGSATQKAAGKAAVEAKKEVHDLDVKVTTSDAGPN